MMRDVHCHHVSNTERSCHHHKVLDDVGTPCLQVWTVIVICVSDVQKVTFKLDAV